MNRRAFNTGLAAAAAGAQSKTYDVAVAGAGVFGAWITYSLLDRGKSVLLADPYGPANSRASSGGETRIIRMGYGKDEIYTRWAQRSLALWTGFFHRVKQPLFHRTGVLWIDRGNEARTRESRQALERCGVRFESLAADELARLYPQMHFDAGTTGILEPDSGALIARRAVQAVVDECVRRGCGYLPEHLRPSDRKVRAGVYVFACGPWLGRIFPDILGNRIFPTRQEVFFFGVPAGDRRFAPPRLPVWIDFSDESGPYGFPDLESRGFKLAFDRHGPPFDPDTGSRVVTEEGLAAARKYLAKRFPALVGAPLVESRVCQYENTSNGDFLVDRHPQLSDVWLVGGGSGHGFKHGPALGEYVAGVLDGGPAEARFSLASKGDFQKRSVY
jgi:glycine/D-amino acid oxidase-like deaminating enzyme